MTLMKDAPLPTFNRTVRSVFLKACHELLRNYGHTGAEEPQMVRRSYTLFGDVFSGLKVGGEGFSGFLSLSIDKMLATKIALKMNHVGQFQKGENLICHVAGELANQLMEILNKNFSVHGCSFASNASDKKENAGEDSLKSPKMPDEWLMTTINCSEGRIFVSFGYSGELGVSSEDAQENFVDAKDMTFF